MTIFIVEKGSQSVKGELSRWMIEVKPGVFVGKLSLAVCESLQKKVSIATIIRKTNTEQGFSITTIGETTLKYVDFDGVCFSEKQSIPKGG